MKLPPRILEAMRAFGARWIIVGFLFLILGIGAAAGIPLGRIMGDCLVRAGMNGVLVLALILPVRAGNGLNFGTPLGIVCGLVGGIFAMEFASPHPFGIESLEASDTLARGWGGFFVAHLIAIPLALLAGWVYGWLLEHVRGQEMMVGIYVGFGAVAGMCIIWLVAPITSPELILPIGGAGARQTILVDGYFKWLLDGLGAVTFEGWLPNLHLRYGESDWPKSFYFPTGLFAYWLGACGLMALFLRTRLGTAMTAAGSNPDYARSIGISVPRMRIASIAISTAMAASGILVFSQSYGFFQLYKGPLYMGFLSVAALLLGGASLRRATVGHVIMGTLLFQALLTSSAPVVNEVVQDSPYAENLANIPEIARLIIQNGVIIYALAKVTNVGGSK